jgi:CubicO group peptidase (beta-lactamase class C family)
MGRRHRWRDVGLAAALMLVPIRVEGQLPMPARDAAESLLEVVRRGDRAQIRAFLEGRFTEAFVASLPVEDHVPILASLGRQVLELESVNVRLDGPFRVAMTLAGPGKRLELRVGVESEPPHRIRQLGWGDAGPELDIGRLSDVGPELGRLAEQPPFSGVVLVAVGPEIRFHQAYGAADLPAGRPNRTDTPFDIGSISKLFTATAALRLVQDGRLELDTPVGRYVDGFSAAVAERVTVRHLLQHRSGFGDYLTHPDFVADPRRFRAPGDYLPLARTQALAFTPGSRESYSNLGFVVLGAILEQVTGREYHAVIEELVFVPAGMTSASAVAGPHAAVRYELQHGVFVPMDSLYPVVASPAGGGFATALDLQRFVAALLDHRLLDAQQTALLLHGFDAAARSDDVPERFSFAGGAPGVHAVVLTRPERRTAVVVLANIGPIEVAALARQIEAGALRR